jgi:hypothetical protein
LTIRPAIFGGMSLSFRRDAFRLPHGPAAGHLASGPLAKAVRAKVLT